TGPCFAAHHGHPVPYTRDDHVAALREIARRVHEKHPHVIIEQHDQIVAGVHSVYTPVYIGHGNGGWDERWANEYMWQPLQDIKDGRARSMFYYNMAYSLPSYIHIDLRDDNENCLAFWWYASTCRHLGIGGTHPDGRNWLAVRRAMSKYLRLQDFFKRGVFLGLDEETHIHVLPGRGAVVCAFNLSERPKTWECKIDLRETGVLTGGKKDARPRVHGAQGSRRGETMSLRADLAPWDVRIIEIAL
ncbi:MAG: hypothetical protein H5T86_14270, partial [Armatimonadetes bacterium]|nr:hypothetical protein [Armatimonadota bacterium]